MPGRRMTMRQRLEDTAGDLLDSASEFIDTVGRPAADRFREQADDVFERVGSNLQTARSRFDAELAEMPGRAMKRLDAVPASSARRRSFFGFVLGVTVGVLIAYFFASDDGAERRKALKSKLSGERQPETVGAGNGHLPK